MIREDNDNANGRFAQEELNDKRSRSLASINESSRTLEEFNNLHILSEDQLARMEKQHKFRRGSDALQISTFDSNEDDGRHRFGNEITASEETSSPKSPTQRRAESLADRAAEAALVAAEAGLHEFRVGQQLLLLHCACG